MIFQAIDNKCPSNPKRFLFVRWYGPHRTNVTAVNKWGPSDWDRYEVKLKCVLCGAEFRFFGIQHDIVLRLGGDVDEVKE